MGGGPPDFLQGFSCPAVLRIPLAATRISHTGLSPSIALLSSSFCYPVAHLLWSITPECTHSGLGSFPFARRYLGNRCFFLFLGLLRCFSSGGSLYTAMYSLYNDWSSSSRVSPFRNRRVVGYLLLTAAYRSLSRLSSALSAKASTLRSFLLDHFLMYSVTSHGLVRIKLLQCLLFSVLIHSITLRCLDISSLFQYAVFKEQKR